MYGFSRISFQINPPKTAQALSHYRPKGALWAPENSTFFESSQICRIDWNWPVAHFCINDFSYAFLSFWDIVTFSHFCVKKKLLRNYFWCHFLRSVLRSFFSSKKLKMRIVLIGVFVSTSFFSYDSYDLFSILQWLTVWRDLAWQTVRTWFKH